jgi:hypothetical protein
MDPDLDFGRASLLCRPNYTGNVSLKDGGPAGAHVEDCPCDNAARATIKVFRGNCSVPSLPSIHEMRLRSAASFCRQARSTSSRTTRFIVS